MVTVFPGPFPAGPVRERTAPGTRPGRARPPRPNSGPVSPKWVFGVVPPGCSGRRHRPGRGRGLAPTARRGDRASPDSFRASRGWAQRSGGFSGRDVGTGGSDEAEMRGPKSELTPVCSRTGCESLPRRDDRAVYNAAPGANLFRTPLCVFHRFASPISVPLGWHSATVSLL